MSERREIPEPGELIQASRPSWAPAFFALGAALALCGLFAQGFMVRGWVYSVIGGMIALAALRGMAREARRDYYSRPRRQRVRGAVLPVEQLSPPRR
ncbi:MAG TPA: hypothetical protein VEQ41_06590 [Solirubrobacterales bacterium]|nr:hypothetical protein [Solirubrobacterales bacterium]